MLPTAILDAVLLVCHYQQIFPLNSAYLATIMLPTLWHDVRSNLHRASAINLLLLSLTALASASLLPFLYLAAHLYLSLSAPEAEKQSASREGASGDSTEAPSAAPKVKSRGQASPAKPRRRLLHHVSRVYSGYR